MTLPEADYDTTAIFDLIPRTRLAAVQAEDAGLALSLACDCPVTAFLFGNQFVVVDISDPAPIAPPEPPPAPAPASPPAPAPVEIGPDDWLPIARLAPGAEPSAGDIGTLAEALSAELSRAVGAGLLNPQEARPVPAAGPIPTRPQIGDTPLPVTVRTAHERPPSPPPRAAPTCPDRDRLALDRWGVGDGFASGLAEARAASTDARDVPTPEGIARLARHYLHYGFGAEAAAWLATIPDPDPIALGLAAFFDDRPALLAQELEDYADCPGAVPLWRAAAGATEAVADAADQGHVVTQFAMLPVHLRAPVLEALLPVLDAAGAIETAAELRQAQTRSAPDHTPTDPASSRIAAAEALTTRLGMEATPDLLDAAEALWREMPDGPASAALVDATLVAAARLGDAGRTIRFAAAVGERTPSRGPDAAATVLSTFAEAGNLSALVIATSDPRLRLGRGEAADAARRTAAEAFANAGLIAEARDLLADLSAPTDADAARLADLAVRLAGTLPRDAAGPAAAWRLGVWDDAAAGNGPVAAAAAAMRDRPDPPAATGEISYGEVDAVLGAAADTRALIADLLSETAPPVADP